MRVTLTVQKAYGKFTVLALLNYTKIVTFGDSMKWRVPSNKFKPIPLLSMLVLVPIYTALNRISKYRHSKSTFDGSSVP